MSVDFSLPCVDPIVHGNLKEEEMFCSFLRDFTSKSVKQKPLYDILIEKGWKTPTLEILFQCDETFQDVELDVDCLPEAVYVSFEKIIFSKTLLPIFRSIIQKATVIHIHMCHFEEYFEEFCQALENKTEPYALCISKITISDSLIWRFFTGNTLQRCVAIRFEYPEMYSVSYDKIVMDCPLPPCMILKRAPKVVYEAILSRARQIVYLELFPCEHFDCIDEFIVATESLQYLYITLYNEMDSIAVLRSLVHVDLLYINDCCLGKNRIIHHLKYVPSVERCIIDIGEETVVWENVIQVLESRKLPLHRLEIEAQQLYIQGPCRTTSLHLEQLTLSRAHVCCVDVFVDLVTSGICRRFYGKRCILTTDSREYTKEERERMLCLESCHIENEKYRYTSILDKYPTLKLFDYTCHKNFHVSLKKRKK